MANTIKINGVTYSDVKEIKVPLASDETKFAVFPDTSDATAVDDDIRSGKSVYVNGKKVIGTHTDPLLTLANGVLSIT